MYATTEVAAKACYKYLLQSTEYPNFQSCVQALSELRERWSVAWRNIALMRGHHTKNYTEVTVHLFNDNVATWCKVYNAVAVIGRGKKKALWAELASHCGMQFDCKHVTQKWQTLLDGYK